MHERRPTLMHDRHSCRAAFFAIDRCTYWTLQPELGEHATEILSGLGYAQAEIEVLLKENVL